jgi:hypothetical protein
MSELTIKRFWETSSRSSFAIISFKRFQRLTGDLFTEKKTFLAKWSGLHRNFISITSQKFGITIHCKNNSRTLEKSFSESIYYLKAYCFISRILYFILCSANPYSENLVEDVQYHFTCTLAKVHRFIPRIPHRCTGSFRIDNESAQIHSAYLVEAS